MECIEIIQPQEFTVPPKNQASVMMNKIASAPQSFRKPSPALRIRNCIHVAPGAVWCPECASAYRTQAREDYAKALSQSKRGDVIRAAQSILKQALLEFALSSAGTKEMEAEYLRLAGSGDMEKAQRIRSQMADFAHKASSRNQQARKDELARKARMNTIASRPNKYVPPPVGENGKFTVEGCRYMFTHHARERMLQRNISEAMIDHAMGSFTEIVPRGQGGWNIVAENGLKVCGFFEQYGDEYMFVIMTVFRIGIDKPEADEL